MKRLSFLILIILILASCQELDNNNVFNDVNVSVFPPSPFGGENGPGGNNLPPGLPSGGQGERVLSKNWNLVSLPIIENVETESFINGYAGIKSIWSWDHINNDWLTYPKTDDFELLTVLEVNKGYWLNVEEGFDLKGDNTGNINQYDFIKGWNLIGVGHATPTIPIEQFFSNGNFWADSCGNGEPVISAWVWSDNTWLVYFPGSNGLIEFNEVHNTSFQALENLEAGMGLWVNSAMESNPMEPCPTTTTTSSTTTSSTTTTTLPQNTVINFGQTISNIFVSQFQVRIEGLSSGANVTTTIKDTAGNDFTLTKNETITNAIFPNDNGIVLSYQGFSFSQVADLESLDFTIILPFGSFVSVYNTDSKIITVMHSENGAVTTTTSTTTSSTTTSSTTTTTLPQNTVINFGQTISNTLILQLQIRISGVLSSDSITTTLKDTVSLDYLFQKNPFLTGQHYPNGDGLVLTHHGTTFSTLADFSSLTFNHILPHGSTIGLYVDSVEIVAVMHSENGAVTTTTSTTTSSTTITSTSTTTSTLPAKPTVQPPINESFERGFFTGEVVIDLPSDYSLIAEYVFYSGDDELLKVSTDTIEGGSSSFSARLENIDMTKETTVKAVSFGGPYKPF